MIAVRIIEYRATVCLAPASLPEVWKAFLATTKGYLAWLFENSGKLTTERLMPWSEEVPESCKAFGK